ncbi:hypothetical protein OAN61_00360, partial [bacterium]|nr:hypothetical protein [bacterium]
VGSDQRKTSATGSLAFGQLSTPNLSIQIMDATTDSNKDFNSNVDLVKDRNCYVHIIAEELVLYNYATNNVGRTTLRMIST